MATTTPNNTCLSTQQLNALRQALGKLYVLDKPEVLKTYECDACLLIKAPPDVVVLPRTVEEVATVVRLCNEWRIPFVPRGAGTGLSGGALPVDGGVLIGLNRMDRILEVDAVNRLAVVECGVVNAWLNREVKPAGLFYAPDPSSQTACTIGGNVAENAGGIHCLKYGVTTDHVLGLEVVTPEGDVVWLGGRHGAYRHVNWVNMFVGSEGTMGIATKAIVKLTPVPDSVKVFLAAFSQTAQATGAVSQIIASGLGPSALEFIDDFTAQAVDAAFHVGFPKGAEAVLLIELDGHPSEVAEKEVRLKAILETFEVSQLRFATNEAERLQLWQARKGAAAAYGRIMPAFYLHDCVIPRAELTHVLHIIKTVASDYEVLIGNVFHAGDGNLHPNILFDPADSAMMARVLEAGEVILKACLGVGGVLSGEHGIGLEKAHFMDQLFGPVELEVMKRLKRVFDPMGLANPAKIFPAGGGCGEGRHSNREAVKAGLPLKQLNADQGW
ncbi:MAG: FAD-binding protein, partial [Cyanobacteria bacterium HKST-UBA03]|nr:FAD-binding protein [Cyanobacteria bacterium HKST-UBA03]